MQSKAYTSKADIWSLGAILYELLTFSHPFKAENPLHIAKKIVDCDYEKLVPGEYSEELVKFVELCMTTDPKRRPNANDCLTRVTPILVQQLDRLKLDFNELSEKYEVLHHQFIETVNDPSILTTAHSLRKTHSDFKQKAPGLRVSNELKLVTVDSQSLKPSVDPIQQVFEIINKIDFICTNSAPSLKKEKELIMIEKFKRAVFGKGKSTSNSKYELIKLMQGSKDHIEMTGISSMTYEKFLQKIED